MPVIVEGLGSWGLDQPRTLERVPVTEPRSEDARPVTPGAPDEYASEKVFISYKSVLNIESNRGKLQGKSGKNTWEAVGYTG